MNYIGRGENIKGRYQVKLGTSGDGEMALGNNKHPQGIWCIRKTYRKN